MSRTDTHTKASNSFASRELIQPPSPNKSHPSSLPLNTGLFSPNNMTCSSCRVIFYLSSYHRVNNFPRANSYFYTLRNQFLIDGSTNV
ncbi:hypothetical protein FKM82_022721 [Ascaphus truei]